MSETTSGYESPEQRIELRAHQVFSNITVEARKAAATDIIQSLSEQSGKKINTEFTGISMLASLPSLDVEELEALYRDYLDLENRLGFTSTHPRLELSKKFLVYKEGSKRQTFDTKIEDETFNGSLFMVSDTSLRFGWKDIQSFGNDHYSLEGALMIPGCPIMDFKDGEANSTNTDEPLWKIIARTSTKFRLGESSIPYYLDSSVRRSAVVTDQHRIDRLIKYEKDTRDNVVIGDIDDLLCEIDQLLS